jgi:hypothetical protein
MRKYRINNEKKSTAPTDEQIKRHKDFSRLSHDYELLTKRPRKPLYKDPKKFVYVIIAGIILYFLFSKR